MNPERRYADTPIALLCLAAVLPSIIGCQEKVEYRRYDPGVAVMAADYANSAAYRTTIGEFTSYQGVNDMAVRGYGLVVGLGKNGSTTCPPAIQDKLLQSVYKHHDFNNPVVGHDDLTPEELIKDPDTAVVLVTGAIPPGAVVGSRFDLFVMAVPGTDTKSLRGGRLYTTDLNVYRVVGPNATIEGKILARGRGPLFHNPFADETSATRDDPLEAIILGGGEVTESRRIRLVLANPSYPRARQIMDRINEQFPNTDKKVADAVTPAFVQINIPPRWRDDHEHFLALVRALYLTRDPTFGAQRARDLAAEIVRPNAPHAMISMCFEGLGQASIPEIEPLYGDTRPWVSFHAAAAGVRLGDDLAVDAMARHAGDPSSEHRYQAIRALGRTESMAGATQALRQLLNDEDPRVRVAAYEELARRGDYELSTRLVADDNFFLDLVPTTGDPFLYAKRTDMRRIAVFGEGLKLAPPVFYRSPEGSLTIDWPEGAEELRVIRRTPVGAVSDSIAGPTDVAKLVEFLGKDVQVVDHKVLGLGLDYGTIVRALYHLTQDKCISAPLVLEHPNAAEAFGPVRKVGRRESEL